MENSELCRKIHKDTLAILPEPSKMYPDGLTVDVEIEGIIYEILCKVQEYNIFHTEPILGWRIKDIKVKK